MWDISDRPLWTVGLYGNGRFNRLGVVDGEVAALKNSKALIVTADDFGVSLPVNEAVERAHRDGILSAASLMTGAPAFADAVERARRLPGLGVGLHIVLIDSVPVLPVEQVPDL